MITLSLALHSLTGTPHCVAAAWVSMAFAAAPPLRTYSTEARMPRLPPVDMSPQARLLAWLTSGATYSARMKRQSASSSSATSWAKPVSVPCPISERAIRTVVMSSGASVTQMPTSTAAAWAADGGIEMPRARPPPMAAEAVRKERRPREAIWGAIWFMARAPYALPLVGWVRAAAVWIAALTRW